MGRTSICLEMVWLGTVIDEERRHGQIDANEISGVWCTQACKFGHAEAERLARVVSVSDTADFLADFGPLGNAGVPICLAGSEQGYWIRMKWV